MKKISSWFVIPVVFLIFSCTPLLPEGNLRFIPPAIGITFAVACILIDRRLMRQQEAQKQEETK